MSYRTLLTTDDDGVLTVTINRPDSLNALSLEVLQDLRDLVGGLSSAGTDGRWPVRGVILIGAGGKAFVAGADVRGMVGMDPADAEAMSAMGQELTAWLEELPLPVIACVDGYALGGGCELALACDFIYATREAVFGQPEVSLGLVPGFGGSIRLQQLVGPGLARELIYTGRRIGADEAYRIGLANAVFADREAMTAAARQTIGEISGQSAMAVALAKGAINTVRGLPLAEALLIEKASFARAFATEEARSRTAAFAAGRSPRH